MLNAVSNLATPAALGSRVSPAGRASTFLLPYRCHHITTTLRKDNRNNNDLLQQEEGHVCTSSTLTLKL